MVASRKLLQRPPCKEMALRIWTSPTCWMMSPSTTSKESSSVLAAARSGGVPAWQRRWVAEAAGRLDQGVALEDVGDGGTAGDVEFIGALGAEGAEDGHRAR